MMNQFMLILLLLMIFWMSFIEAMIHKHHRAPVLSAVKQTMDQGYVTCGLQLIETVPKILEKKKIKSKHKTIFDAWLELIDNSKEELYIMSQWAMKEDFGRGQELFKHLKNLVKRSETMLRYIYFNHEGFPFDKNVTPNSLRKLEKYENQVKFRTPSISGLTNSNVTENVLHSKMMISDNQNIYLGSANLGGRCTTRTKELGILITNCPALARDAFKQWILYWNLYGIKSLPKKYPPEWFTSININSPLRIYNNLDNTLYDIFIAASPKSLIANGRTDDLTAILKIIDKAEKYVHIVVGEYLPMDAYKSQKPWKIIDTKIKQAIKRGVKVKMMVSDHASRVGLMKRHLKSLMSSLNKQQIEPVFEAKLFDSQFDFHNFHGTHAKFMVTDKSGFIGTSNWTEDYFEDSAGISIIFEPWTSSEENNDNRNRKNNLLSQLEDIFQRDWRSKLAKNIVYYKL